MAPAPVSLPEEAHVEGEALVRHAVAEKGDPSFAGPAQVDGKGRAHEEVSEVHGEGRNNDGEKARAGIEHGHGDELRAAGENHEGHEADLDDAEPGLLGHHAEGEPYGEVAEADRPGRPGAFTHHRPAPFFRASCRRPRIFHA